MHTRFIVSLLCVLVMGLCAQAGTISYVQITGDADCGISAENIYTHTLDFGTGTPGALINGVQFDAYNLAANGTLNFNRTVATGNLADHAGNANHNVTGGLVDLLTDMYYNDGNAAGGGETTWTLSGLTPGQAYSARIYARQWGADNQRTVIFTFDPDGAGPVSDVTETINQDDATTVGMPSDNTAYYINYEFIAVAGEDLVITVAQDLLNQSWHLYGITNHEISLGTAYLPSPANDTVDIPRDTLLSWKPGETATAHNVYFGMSYDDVLAGDTSVLVSQGQTEATFALPEILDFSTTYYWRVDEVLSDSTVLAGPVWSFETEPFAYAIEGIIATSNLVVTEGPGPENTVNGSGLNADDQHSIEPDDMWSGLPDETGEPTYIQFEFDRVYKMHEMLVWNHNLGFEYLLGIGFKDVTVEYSTDGVDWLMFGDVQLAQAPGSATYTPNSIVSLEGVPAKFVRLTINSTWGTLSDEAGLSEVRFMQIPTYAREPQPADGATNVTLDATLAWRGGRDAAVHEVSLGTDMDAMDLVDTVAQSSYDPGGLNLDSTYYWTVVEVNDAAATPAWDGAVWTFSTQEYIEIDSFETYDDDFDAGTAVWQTWLDGLEPGTDNGGAYVGHDPSPFSESTYVHSGSQAMPLYYDHSITGVSETDRLFSPGQNWSRGGIESLSFYFFGRPDNAAGQLYVKINGTKVPYAGSPEDVKLPIWQPFTVDLTSVNAQNVTTLSIGIEGTNGAGLLIIDDVRLYAETTEVIDAVMPSDDGLVAYWPLDGDATDVVGGHNGTIGEGLEFVDGIEGQATNGGDLEDITVAYAPDLALNTFTVAAWVNVVDVIAARGIIGTRFNGENTFDLKVEATRIHGDIGDGAAWLNTSVDITEAQGGVISLNTWHHIAYAFDAEAGTADLYLDGALAAVVTFTGTPLLMKEGQELHINSCYPTEFMRGSVDEVRIYNRALTPGEVAGLVGRPGPIYKGL